MLVLSRKVGESIQLGDNITVVVTEVAPNRVRLAIAAPPETRVLRGELLKQPPVARATQSLELVNLAKDSKHANSSSCSPRPAAPRAQRTRRSPAEFCVGKI